MTRRRTVLGSAATNDNDYALANIGQAKSLDDGDANPEEVVNQTEEARQRIIRYWQLFYGTTPEFTNSPGSQADLIDVNNALNALSGKFYKVE